MDSEPTDTLPPPEEPRPRKPKRRAKESTSKYRVQLQLDELKAIELRLAGATLLQIATACGKQHPSWAHKTITRAFKRERLPLVEEEVKRMLARLERHHLSWWPRATANPPDETATDVCLRIYDRQCKILGIGPNSPLIGELMIGLGLAPNGRGGPANGYGYLPADDPDRAARIAALPAEDKERLADLLREAESILDRARAE